MKNTEEKYERIIQELPIGTLVFKVNNGKNEILAINERLIEFANMVHQSVEFCIDEKWSREKLIEVFSENVYAFAAEEDISKVELLLKEATTKGYAQTIFRLRGTEGLKTKWISVLCSSKKIAEDERVFYTLFLDCTKTIAYEKELLEKQTELIKKQNDLVQMSKYDAMTGVCNRLSYRTFLEQADGRKVRDVGMLYADINGIKAINDEFGHQVGDSIICDFAFVLQEVFDKKYIYRISGDEFVVIQDGIVKDKFDEKEQDLFHLIGSNHIAAIGAVWQPEISDLKQCIYQTELLMKIQKQKYYMETETMESKHRPRVLKLLADDLGHDRFLVYLQPKAEINSKNVVGAEALIRKIDKDGSVVSPYQFVPILEKELLISQIDFFVLEEVCKTMKRWKKENKRIIKVSVNMSRVTMAEHDFLNHVLEICDKYETDRNKIELEITESTTTKDHNRMIEIVAKLAELGFGVSLDDMGNDYSSIKMVTMDGIDTVKIDRSLVLQMESKKGIALVKHIIELCHELDRKCIAEGVESIQQMNVLKELNCDYYQGFLLDKPIPIQQFEKYIER